MKKILAHIFALPILGFALVSCDKDKDRSIFNENDLIGCWACAKSITTDELYPPYSLSFSADHRVIIKAYDDTYTAEGSWAVKGDKLVLSGEDFKGWDVTLKELDEKHLQWNSNWGVEDSYFLESYTNISKIIPGTWKNVGPDAWYVVTIDESGTSKWVKNGITDVGTYNWHLGIKDGRVTVCFGDESSSWSDEQAILEVSDDYLAAKSKTGAIVAFEREGGTFGYWEVESDNPTETGSSKLSHAWYFYDEGKKGYDILFSDVADYSNRYDSNWAFVDLAKDLCGESHLLTDNLHGGNWDFLGGTNTYLFYNYYFTSGTIYLSVNETINKIHLRMSGITEFGVKIKINYFGPAERKDEYVGYD